MEGGTNPVGGTGGRSAFEALQFGFCFCLSLAAAWGIAQVFPPHADSLLSLKHAEMRLYFGTVFGVPFATLLLHAGIHRLFKRKRRKAPAHIPEVPRHSGASHWIYGLFLPIFLFLFLPRPTATRAVDLIDDGILIAAAHQTEYGKLPYRDIYFHYGPLREIVQTKIAFAWFGKSWAGLRHFFWYWEPWGALGLYFLALLIVRYRVWLGFMAAVLLGRLDVTLSDRGFLPTVVLMLIILGERRPKIERWMNAAAGMLLVIAYFYSMEGGLLTTAAVGLYFLTQARAGLPKIRDTAIGAMALLIPTFFGLALYGLLPTFMKNLFLAGPFLAVAGKPVFVLSAPLRHAFHDPLFFFEPDGWPLRLWFPILLYMIGLAGSFYHRDWRKPGISAIRLISLAGLFHFVMAMGRADYEHWLKGTPLVWVLAIVFVDRAVPYLRLRSPTNPLNVVEALRAFAIAAGLFVLLRYQGWAVNPQTMISWNALGPLSVIVPDMETRWPRLGRVPTFEGQFETLKQTIDDIQQRVKPGDSLYVFTDECGFYFLADRPNPTRYPVVALAWTSQDQEEVLRDLETQRPTCVLARGTPTQLAHLPYLKPIADYIYKNYRFDKQVGEYLLWVPRQAAPTPT